MQDMVIKGTGNSRFLKSVENFLDLFPTYEAFAAAFASGVLPVDFNGINPDGITQMGTQYAKATVLTDETATLFGLNSTAVPDDVFRWLGEWGRSNWKLLAEYNEAGAYTFTVPDDVDELGVFILGGGGGGGAAKAATGSRANAIGGRSGGLKQVVLKKSAGDFDSGANMPVVVGAGATGATRSSNGESTPTVGGTSAFNNIISEGGQPGDDPAGSLSWPAPYGLSMFASGTNDAYSPVRNTLFGYAGRNIFDPNDTHVYCGAGGSASSITVSSNSLGTSEHIYQTTAERTKGKAGGASSFDGFHATAPGDGGGAAARSGATSTAVVGGNGADGLVLVYGRKVVPTDAV